MKKILGLSLVGAAALGLSLASSAGAGSAQVQVGKPVPNFTAKDELGKEVKLSDYQGKLVVLEWTNQDCPFVQGHYRKQTMEKLASKYGAKDVVWLAVNSTDYNKPADTLKWKQEQGFEYPTLQDASGKLGHMFGAKTTPHMFVIDTKGTLAYDGAIDDDPRESSDHAVNYVDGALQSLENGKSPDPSQTQSYGCSVKYSASN